MVQSEITNSQLSRRDLLAQLNLTSLDETGDDAKKDRYLNRWGSYDRSTNWLDPSAWLSDIVVNKVGPMFSGLKKESPEFIEQFDHSSNMIRDELKVIFFLELQNWKDGKFEPLPHWNQEIAQEFFSLCADQNLSNSEFFAQIWDKYNNIIRPLISDVKKTL